MSATTPTATPEFMTWTWADIEPRYAAIEAMPLTADTLDDFLQQWSDLSAQMMELEHRLNVATTVNTADEEASRRWSEYLDSIYGPVSAAEQRLKEKLLASGLEPEGFEVPLRKMRAEAAIFREENLPLLSEEGKLSEEYFKITGAQTVEIDGQEMPIEQARVLLQDLDRDRREQVWRAIAERRLQDREALNNLWVRLLALRRTIAANAGFPDVRAYAWERLHRFDYTPEDAEQFHRSVEEVVVPAVARIHDRRRQQLGVEMLRPWDLEVDPLGRPPLRPFTEVEDLIAITEAIFRRVDPVLGGYFSTMRNEGLLDLASRANKAPGGYCTAFPASGRPFIFSNAAGTRLAVETLLHEGGHSFHFFEAERSGLPYFAQRNAFNVGAEFSEVGSMAMEFLAAPYLSTDQDGFYAPADAARARTEHLEQRVLLLWARLAAFDSFQHWVYTHPDEASNPAQCDLVCADLVRRFNPGVDWTGVEDTLQTSWHNILHLFVAPFYMIEYGLALLGAIQIWDNARRDQAGAVARYRQALALGDTRSIPDLFAAAGARFAFDADTLRRAVSLVEETIEELSG